VSGALFPGRPNLADVRSEEMSDLAELDLQRERAAKNQSLFREVNERIEGEPHTSTFIEFIGECADEECSDLVSLTHDEYEQVRARSDTFFLVGGHEIPEVEEVVEATDRYVVVAKLGAGGPVAERFDPRRRAVRNRRR